MYLFRQFCGFSWLAIFFKKSIVSRGSVNGTCQKGPRLAQSFSTKVAIESGLYIAPGYAPDQVRTAIWQVSGQIARSAQDLSIWDLPDGCPELPPDRPGSEWRFGPGLSGKSLRTAKSRKSWKIQKIAKIAKISTFGQKLTFWRFLQFSGNLKISDFCCHVLYGEHIHVLMCTLLSETASDIMCTHAWRMFHTLTQRTSCRRQTRTLHQSCHLLHVLINRALWK